MLLAIFESGRAFRALSLSVLKPKELKVEPLRALRVGLFTWDKNVHGAIEVIVLRPRVNVFTGTKRFTLVIGCKNSKIFVHGDGSYDVIKDWSLTDVLYAEPKEPTPEEMEKIKEQIEKVIAKKI